MNKILTCYIPGCGSQRFEIGVEGQIILEDEGTPILLSSRPLVNYIKCLKCGIKQYGSIIQTEPGSDPLGWFTNEVECVWDEENQVLRWPTVQRVNTPSRPVRRRPALDLNKVDPKQLLAALEKMAEDMNK